MAKTKKGGNPTNNGNNGNKKNDQKVTLKKKKRKDRKAEKALKLAAKHANLKVKATVQIDVRKAAKEMLREENKVASGKGSKSNKRKINEKRIMEKTIQPVKKVKQDKEEDTKIKRPNRGKNQKKQKNMQNKETKNRTDKMKKSLKDSITNTASNMKIKQEQGKPQQKTNKKVEKLELVKEKITKKQKKNKEKLSAVEDKNITLSEDTKKHSKLNLKRLEKILFTQQEDKPKKKGNSQTQSLRERMMLKLKASRFRYINETLYNRPSVESKQYFKEDPDAFVAYHEGYRQQLEQWPLNPLDKIIRSIKKLPKEYIIADFGCGEARLASCVSHKVYSFDLVSLNSKVTACDMAHTPLLTNGVNVVVFCLSLMGTNLNDYLTEANRVLKKGGVLKIADIESRFENVENFITNLREYGFKLTTKDISHNLFYFFDFQKEKDLNRKKKKLPEITLKPCLYKKR